MGGRFLRCGYTPVVENEAVKTKKRTNNIAWLVPCDSGSSGHGDRLSCRCSTRPPWSAHIPVLPTYLAVLVVVQDAPVPHLWTCQAQHSPGHQREPMRRLWTVQRPAQWRLPDRTTCMM